MKRFSLARWLTNRKPCRRKPMQAGRGLEGLEQRVVPATQLITLAGGVNVSTVASFPFTDVTGRVFFYANTANQGQELFVSDGTNAGTRQVADINAGGVSSLPTSTAGRPNLTANVNGVFYWPANNGTVGEELWRSDGTLAGTRLVRDINTGSTSAGSNIQWMANVNGRLFFNAFQSTTASELWVTDGSTGGTRIFDIDPGGLTSDPDYITNFNGVAYFGANQTAFDDGQEPWRSDGNVVGNGTRRLADVDSSLFGGGNPQSFTPAGNQLFFTADDGSNGRELWVTDGTTANTRLVLDIRSGTADGIAFSSSGRSPMVNVNGILYFAANDGVNGTELWRSDGTALGTYMVSNIYTGSLSSLPTELVNVNGTLFFSAIDQANFFTLYKSDGTAVGTTVVPSSTDAFGLTPRQLVNYNGFLAFAPTGGSRPNELWISDGTAAGTAPAEPTANPAFTNPQGLTVAGQTLFMRVQSNALLARFRLSEPPTDLLLSPSSVNENSAVGTVVGTLAAVDPDTPNDSFTYALVSGAGGQDNARFRIVGDKLQVNSAIDFEQTQSLSVRVRVTDRGGNQLDKVFTIRINDVNELPTDLTLNPGTIVENAPLDSLVGIFAPADADRLPQTFSYSLVGGAGSADNALFKINPGSNRLLTNAIFDFEAKSTYSIRVQVTNDDTDPATAPVVFEKALTILVTNQNEAPIQVTLTGSNVLENQPEGTVVGVVSGADVDAGDTLEFSVQSTSAFPDGSFFQIVGNQLVTTSELDFEAAPIRTILIRATDSGGLFVETPFVINIRDLNDLATTIQLSNTSIPENSPAGTSVGILGTPVPAYTATLFFQLSPGIGGEDNATFFVDGYQLRVAPGATLDFEAKSGFNVRIKATDQTGLSFEKRFVITLTDVNEAPGPLTLTNSTVPEAQPVGALVGLLRAPDPESADTVTFTLVPGQGSSDNARFKIFGSGLQTNEEFNFDVRRFYSVRVRASDQNGNFVEQSYQITITQAPKVTPLYRLFSEALNYHFFTTSRSEFEAAKAGGFRDETTQLPGVQVLERQLTGSLPLYRLYNLQTRRHYYTTSIGEANFLQGLVKAGMPGFGTTLGWRLEKIEGFIYDAPQGNTVEVFRLYNSRVGTHLFTESAAVRDAVLRAFPTEWSQHASLGFAFQGRLPSASASAVSAPVLTAASASPEPSLAPASAVVAASNRLETLVAVTSSAPVSAAATAATAGETEPAAVAPVVSTGSVAPEVESLDAVFTTALVGGLLD
jgi:ELWxxDGT repeat protein